MLKFQKLHWKMHGRKIYEFALKNVPTAKTSKAALEKSKFPMSK